MFRFLPSDPSVDVVMIISNPWNLSLSRVINPYDKFSVLWDVNVVYPKHVVGGKWGIG